jgi:hypothetical protein
MTGRSFFVNPKVLYLIANKELKLNRGIQGSLLCPLATHRNRRFPLTQGIVYEKLPVNKNVFVEFLLL